MDRISRLPPEITLRIFELLYEDPATRPSFFTLIRTSSTFHNLFRAKEYYITYQIVCTLISYDCLPALLAYLHLAPLQTEYLRTIASGIPCSELGYVRPEQVKLLLGRAGREDMAPPLQMLKDAAILYGKCNRILEWMDASPTATGCDMCDFLEALCVRFADEVSGRIMQNWFRDGFMFKSVEDKPKESGMVGLVDAMQWMKLTDEASKNQMGDCFHKAVVQTTQRSLENIVASLSGARGETAALPCGRRHVQSPKPLPARWFKRLALQLWAGSVDGMFDFVEGRNSRVEVVKRLISSSRTFQWEEIYFWKTKTEAKTNYKLRGHWP